VREHPGLDKVMHQSKVGMPFKEILFTRTTAAVQRCMDAGAAASGRRHRRSRSPDGRHRHAVPADQRA
jgi:hypothetical protein